MALPSLSRRATAKAPLAEYLDYLAPRLQRMAGYYARRLRLDRDDLLQEAHLGVFCAWLKLDSRIGSPPQFLLRCARWRLLSYARKCRAHSTTSLGHDTARLDAALAAADTRLDLEAMAQSLKPMQRRVLSCLLSGMTWREAGQAMGCTPANIAYHVRMIRRALSARVA